MLGQVAKVWQPAIGSQLIFEIVCGLSSEEHTKKIPILCTDTRVEIPANVGMIEAIVHVSDLEINGDGVSQTG